MDGQDLLKGKYEIKDRVNIFKFKKDNYKNWKIAWLTEYVIFDNLIWKLIFIIKYSQF